MRGIFVTFEGVEGSGKSTQGTAFVKWLKDNGRQALFLREPGSTKLGEKVRDVLLFSKKEEVSSYAELFLFLAARAQILREKIKPALNEGAIVVLDRYCDSTFAYQAYGEGLSLEEVVRANNLVTSGLLPDITFLLDLDIECALSKTGPKDRIENKGLEFHKRVLMGYYELAKESHGRIHIVKVQDDLNKTQSKIRRVFSSKFPL